MVSSSGQLTVLTAEASNEDLLIVLDGRGEDLYVYRTDARYGVQGLARLIDEQRMPGWYLRVLRGGELSLGDAMVLVARPNPAILAVDLFQWCHVFNHCGRHQFRHLG
jgi:hypothetical protein